MGGALPVTPQTEGECVSFGFLQNLVLFIMGHLVLNSFVSSLCATKVGVLMNCVYLMGKGIIL